MSTILNDRDVLLRGSAQRSTPANDRALLLSASSNVFKVPVIGQASPPAVTLTATPIGMTGVVTFTTTPQTRLIVSNNQAVLAFSDTGIEPVTVIASFAKDGVGYEARQTIVRVTDGQSGNSTGQAFAYKRSATAPADNPGPVTFSFGQGRIVSPSTDDLANGWSKSIPGGGDPLYVTMASASNSGPVDDIAANEWATPVLYVQNGLSSATVMIFQRSYSTTPPLLPSANATYTFASALLTGLNNGWSAGVPPAGGGYLYVSTATAVGTAATDTILPSEWAAVRLFAKDGSDGYGRDGQRGNVDVVGTSSGSWSDALANKAISDAGYSVPQNRDRVTLTATGYAETRFYNNGAWLPIAAYINGNMLVNGTLSANALTGGTISGVSINIGSGNFRVERSVDGIISTSAAFLTGCRVSYDNVASPVAPTAKFRAYPDSGFPAVVATGAVAAHFDGPVTSVAYSESADYSTRTNNCRPVLDNAYNCGTLAYKWMGMTSATAVVVSSDARLKLEVRDTDLGLDFIKALRPVSYRLREAQNVIEHGPDLNGPLPEGEVIGPNVIVTPMEGKRRHYGLIAQEVRAALLARGVENAAFWALEDPADPDSKQALRYEELIPVLIRAIQELSVSVRAQEPDVTHTKAQA
jgi:Chaperone of endosialidase